MHRFILTALLATSASFATAAPVPKEKLLKPPADAAHYLVVSDAGKHGDMWRWTLPDGRTAYRHAQSLRGWITETDEVVTVGADGLPNKIEVRGITPNGDAAETFELAAGKASWTSLSDSGSAEGKTGY
ncbi:MAG: amidohydrolase family protein, partial [Sphingomicrobium sp.]